MGKRILITGATGFIGREIARALADRGDSVAALSRDADRAAATLGEGVEIIAGDPVFSGDWQQRVRGFDAVINLAGQPIAGRRWNARYRQLLHDSRVETTQFLVQAIGESDVDERPEVLVSASGVDYYPFAVDLGAALEADEDDEVDERSPPGDTAMARICRNWETEAKAAARFGVRVVLMRTGIVLGRAGALPRMTRPFKFLVGGRLGHGRQWTSWVHIDDAVAAYLFAVDTPDLSGSVNLVAPQPVRNAELARSVGRAVRRPAWLPVPAFALKAAVGEISEYLLNGRRVVPAALKRHGFRFRFAEIDAAIADLL